MYSPPGPYAPPVHYRGAPGVEEPAPKDISDLRTLGICTIVYGVFVAFVSLFGLVYVIVGIAAMSSPPSPRSGSDPIVMGGFFAIFGALFTLLLGAKAALLLASGYGLTRHKWRTLSYVAAGLSCLNMPIGLILGIFTFNVLGRPSVRALYSTQ